MCDIWHLWRIKNVLCDIWHLWHMIFVTHKNVTCDIFSRQICDIQKMWHVTFVTDRFVTHKECDMWHLWQTDLLHTKNVTPDMRHLRQTDLWHTKNMTHDTWYLWHTKSVTHDMWHLWQTDLWHKKIVTCYICDTQKMWRVTFVTDRFVLHKKHDMWHIILWHTKNMTCDTKNVRCDICDRLRYRVRYLFEKKLYGRTLGGTDDQLYINSEAYKYNVLIAAIQEHFLYVFPSAYLFMNKPSK